MKYLGTSIDEWPQPQKAKKLQSFLCYTDYYDTFVRGYARIVRPLNHLEENLGRWHKEFYFLATHLMHDGHLHVLKRLTGILYVWQFVKSFIGMGWSQSN